MPKKTIARLDTMPAWTIQQYNEAIDALMDVRDWARDGDIPRGYDNEGICGLWAKQLRDDYGWTSRAYVETVTVISKIAADWPHSRYPGIEHDYPIRNDKRFDVWQGPNQLERLDLIAYALNRLKSFRQQLRRKAGQPRVLNQE